MIAMDPDRIRIIGVAGAAQGELVFTVAEDEEIGQQCPEVLGLERRTRDR